MPLLNYGYNMEKPEKKVSVFQVQADMTMQLASCPVAFTANLILVCRVLLGA